MTDAIPPKRLIFEQLARVAKALAQPNRLDLLEALSQGERSVEELARICLLSVANASHHLQILRDGGFVVPRKSGVQVYYRLSGDEVTALLSALQRMGERHIAEIEQLVRRHFATIDDLTPISQDELLRLLRTDQVVVIDVRPESEYRAGHVAGAINIPLDHLSRQLPSLPRDHEIIAYCRGPYCLLAFEAVQALREHGYRARRLQEGFPEWKARHLPLASGTEDPGRQPPSPASRQGPKGRAPLAQKARRGRRKG